MTPPRFVFVSVLVALALWLGAVGVRAAAGAGWDLWALTAATALCWLTGTGAYALAYGGLHRRIGQFLSMVMGGMLLKMLIGIGVMIVVAQYFRPLLWQYVAMYAVAYFGLTALEVYGLLRKLRPNFLRDSPPPR